MNRIRKLFYLTLALSLLLVLMLPGNLVVAQDEPCDVNESDIDSFYITPPINAYPIYGQTFTAHWDYKLDKVDLWIWGGSGVNANLNLYIYEWNEDDGEPMPLSLDIENETFYFNNAFKWCSFDISEYVDVELLACKKYFMFLYVVSSNGEIRFGGNTNQYTEGEYASQSAGGAPWVLDNEKDLKFRLYGSCEGDAVYCGPCDMLDGDQSVFFDILTEGDPDPIYGQTFVSHWEYDLTKVYMKVSANDTAKADLYLGIWPYDEEAGKPGEMPFGGVMYGARYDVNGTDSRWLGWDFESEEITLQACEKYALLLYIHYWNGDDEIRLEGLGNDQYPDGNKLLSYDDGTTWQISQDQDYKFKLYGCEGDPADCEEPLPPAPLPPTGQPQPGGTVGIDVYQVNKVALIVPWIALAAVIIAGVLIIRRLRTHI
jgi:hypothetical protein